MFLTSAHMDRTSIMRAWLLLALAPALLARVFDNRTFDNRAGASSSSGSGGFVELATEQETAKCLTSIDMNLLRFDRTASVEASNHWSRIQAAWKGEPALCQISMSACAVLYQAALVAKGPVLEIGAFTGCSTACLASAIRDRKDGSRLTSCDLFLNTVDEFERYFAKLTFGYDKCDGSRNCAPSAGPRHVLTHGGFELFWRRHLQQLHLLNYVIPVKGDFLQVLPKAEFAVVFADVVHSATHITSPGKLSEEVKRNLHALVERFSSDCSRSMFIFDDLSLSDALKYAKQNPRVQNVTKHGRVVVFSTVPAS